MSVLIDALDATLKELFLRQIALLKPPVKYEQVGFQPPDRDWRSAVTKLSPKDALNVYLVDLRENRRLRSNERTVQHSAGAVFEEPAPMRLDCHYLVTAWSPASDATDRTLAEHALLSEVTAVLAAVPELVPRRVFTPGGLPQLFPSELADEVLPMTVTPPDGFVKLAEFWGTMPGQAHPWKPAVYLVVTVPVASAPLLSGTEVTTVTLDARDDGHAEGAETVTAIAGVVLDTSVTPPTPIALAWVRLEDSTGAPLAATVANADGEFTFNGLTPGTYRLAAGASGHLSPQPLPVTVPSPTGSYDLQLT
jgi:hypothetical protein